MPNYEIDKEGILKLNFIAKSRGYEKTLSREQCRALPTKKAPLLEVLFLDERVDTFFPYYRCRIITEDLIDDLIIDIPINLLASNPYIYRLS